MSHFSFLFFSFYQQHLNEEWGGVVPRIAMDEHKNKIDQAIIDALTQAGMKSIAEVDAIAVTKGPGLEVCLRVGLRKAQVFSISFRDNNINNIYSYIYILMDHLKC